MAIIACLKEFNNESYDEFLERGYRIVMGLASKSDMLQASHRVCSAHMMQIIKQHAKELCEKNLPASSQVHIAMRFFGRLIASNTLQELNHTVRLGHYIFKSKYIDSAVLRTLEPFQIMFMTLASFHLKMSRIMKLVMTRIPSMKHIWKIMIYPKEFQSKPLWKNTGSWS